MNFLKCIVFIISFIEFNLSYAQTDTAFTIVGASSYKIQIEQGRKALRDHNYLKAIQTFRTLANKNPKDSKAQFWLAKTHYVFNNYGFSLQYAELAYELDSVNIDKEVFFLLAQNYHHLGDLEEAVKYYKLCLNVLPKRTIALFEVPWHLERAKYALEKSKDIKFAEKIPLSNIINSGFDDYSPVLTSDGKELYFTSRRSSTTGGLQNPYDGQYFEDIYVANWDDEYNTWDSITNQGILQKVNNDGFESLSWISNDKSTAYITLNNEAVGGGGIRTKGSDIFEITLNESGKWGKPKNNKTTIFNTVDFDASATLTSDGNTIYFTSDRNLKNGSDIYTSKKINNKWTEPEALPDLINTRGNETTPYITPDGQYLFFSSEEHLGMGGYDIFYTKNLGNGKWSKPVNIGISINSTNDDTHFQYYPELKKAFFASRVNKNKKSDMDIFEIDMSNFVFSE